MSRPSGDQAHNDETTVLTPGGYRARGLVEKVGAGEAVGPAGAGRFGVIPVRERPILRRGRLTNQEFVLTPGGYRNRALVHRVEHGHLLDVADDRVRLVHQQTRAVVDIPRMIRRPGDVPGFGEGWITYCSWTNSTGIPVSSFRTTWLVPPPPATQSGQTIFLFNGIDPSDPSAAILQPVLQWGVSAAGGGAYWSVASWYVLGSGEAFHTNLIKVNPGDALVGVMSLTGQANGLFSYTSQFEGIAGTTLPVQNVAELVWCNQTLEAYDIAACSDYPNTDFTRMGSISLATGATTPAITWTPVNLVTDCGQHAVVRDDSATSGSVDLYYREPSNVFDLGRFAEQVRILFGVTNDGGGIVILPNGRIIKIPPHNPVFQAIADGLADAARGFAVQEDAKGGSLRELAEAIDRMGLELVAKGLEGAYEAARTALRTHHLDTGE